MVPGRARNIGWFRTTLALGILLSGLVCAGIDLVHDHLNVVTGSKCQHHSDKSQQHIVNLKSADAPPCNACFLERLLGQTLLPTQPIGANQGHSVKRPDNHQPPEIAAYYLDPVTRGPPLV